MCMNAGAAAARVCGVNNKPTTFVVFTTPVCPRRAPWQMEQFASALEELGVLEVADLAEVTGAQLDAMGMTVIHCASGCDGKCPPLKTVRRRVRKGSRCRLPPRARVRKVSRGRRLPTAAGPSE